MDIQPYIPSARNILQLKQETRDITMKSVIQMDFNSIMKSA